MDVAYGLREAKAYGTEQALPLINNNNNQKITNFCRPKRVRMTCCKILHHHILREL